MDVEPHIMEAAIEYCTTRRKFLYKHKGDLHHHYLDMLFLNSGSRPDLAEMVPLWVLGHKTDRAESITHGYDGVRIDNHPVECKTSNRKHLPVQSSFGTITVNDVSENTIGKYDADQPEIIFSFFVRGHLVAIFEVLWKDIRPWYVTALDKPGRKSFAIGRNAWEEFAILRYQTTNKMVLKQIPARFRILLK